MLSENVVEFLRKLLESLVVNLNELMARKNADQALPKARDSQLEILNKQVADLQAKQLTEQDIITLEDILNRIKVLQKEIESFKSIEGQIGNLQQDIEALKRVISLLSQPQNQALPDPGQPIVPMVTLKGKMKDKIEILIRVLNSHLKGDVAPLDKVFADFVSQVEVEPGFNLPHLTHYLHALGYTIRQRQNLIIPHAQRNDEPTERQRRHNRDKALAIYLTLGEDKVLTVAQIVKSGYELSLFKDQVSAQSLIAYIRQNAKLPYLKNRFFKLQAGGQKDQDQITLTELGHRSIKEHREELEDLVTRPD